jgi:hypothetical protein
MTPYLTHLTQCSSVHPGIKRPLGQLGKVDQQNGHHVNNAENEDEFDLSAGNQICSFLLTDK